MKYMHICLCKCECLPEKEIYFLMQEASLFGQGASGKRYGLVYMAWDVVVGFDCLKRDG